jgi:hypothetical protein
VHATTIYRRWGTAESLILDVAVEDVNVQSPIPVTGDLERDLTTYVRRLLTAIRRQGRLAFFEVLLTAARQATTVEKVTDVVGPRLAQPLDPDRDAGRLIETALLACRGPGPLLDGDEPACHSKLE